ncbi:MAG: MmcB family DNA repair protein [Alphaproteobacteria bacterium]|nr:MmcB family DNA repair protein [Alphaproteobacteria bacterium]
MDRFEVGAMQQSFLFSPDTGSAAEPALRKGPVVEGWSAATAISSSEQPDAADITRGAVRLLDTLGFRPLTEMPLASGRRVDAIGLDGRGRFAVIEVKSSLADLRADDKWPEYLPFCDWFYFAVAPDFRLDALPENTGIIIADRYGGEVVRASPVTPMASAKRRRQTLLFAHTASSRLFRVLESGL